MSQNTLFGDLLGCTYKASGSAEPLERYYASMFSAYHADRDSQPSCSSVSKILNGKAVVPWKVMQFYRDPKSPRFPGKLEEDLSALADCCFAEAHRRVALRNCLAAFLGRLPEVDRDDLVKEIPCDDVIRLWTGLTWYAMCVDHE